MLTSENLKTGSSTAAVVSSAKTAAFTTAILRIICRTGSEFAGILTATGTKEAGHNVI